MTATYDCIATTTLSTATASVTFSSISGSFTDLVLVFNGSLNTASEDYYIVQFNSDTGGNYSYTGLYGTGSAAGSLRGTSTTYNYVGLYFTPSAYQNTNTIINVMNYANTTTNKTTVSRANNSAIQIGAYAGLWRSTAAITSIKSSCLSGASFASGSTFALYGVKAE